MDATALKAPAKKAVADRVGIAEGKFPKDFNAPDPQAGKWE